jgi:adenylate cyclase
MSLALTDLRTCFEGAIPAVIATAAADGTPNVTYLSRVQLVDDERVALSNQFFSKTARNLAENPQASLVLIEPQTYAQFRLTLAYERTERRGPVFERLREDVDALAVIVGMQDVFKLRAADIYRVVDIELLSGDPSGAPAPAAPPPEQLAELVGRLARCGDLDTMLNVTLDGLAEVFGYEHSLVLLLDEDGQRLYTIASRGYDTQGVGSEVVVGEGLVGLAAARCAPMRIGSLRQMAKYSARVRQSYEDSGDVAPLAEGAATIALPGLPDAESRVAVPAMAYGQLVGVLLLESREVVAFTAADEAVLSVVATLLANAVERERAVDDSPATAPVALVDGAEGPPLGLRFFEVDGSVFLDGDYLIKGVAGRLLWSLVNQHEREGRVDFTHRELRLDPSLELPPFRDNLENRVLLLKRRLDERDGPLRIEKTGRGQLRLHVTRPLRLERGSN